MMECLFERMGWMMLLRARTLTHGLQGKSFHMHFGRAFGARGLAHFDDTAPSLLVASFQGVFCIKILSFGASSPSPC